MLHLTEFSGPCHPEAQVHQIVAVVSVEHDAMMPIIHPEVAAVALFVLDQFHADDPGGKVFPFIGILHPDTHVAQLGYLDH